MIYIRCRPLAPVDWATAGLGYRWFADQKFVDDFQYYYYYYGPAGLDPDYGSFFFLHELTRMLEFLFCLRARVASKNKYNK